LILIDAPMVVDCSLVDVTGAGDGVFLTDAGEGIFVADSGIVLLVLLVLLEALAVLVVFGVFSNICEPIIL